MSLAASEKQEMLGSHGYELKKGGGTLRELRDGPEDLRRVLGHMGNVGDASEAFLQELL